MTGGYDDKAVQRDYRESDLATCEKQIYGRFLRRGRVLDIGCYVGRVSFALASRGLEVEGIEPVASAIAEAKRIKAQRKVKNVHFRVGSATKLPYHNHSFDYVLFPFNTIEAIAPQSARKRSLAEAYRVLKPGGRLILSTHNRLYPKWLAYAIACKIIYPRLPFGSVLYREPASPQPIEIHFYMPERMEREIAQAGFSLLERIPSQNYGHQYQRAHLLADAFHRPLSAPEFFYVARK